MSKKVLKYLKIIAERLNYFDIRVYSLKGGSHEKKADYQPRFVKFDIKPGETVLDIGSGGEPFSPATHLVDLYPNDTHHRHNRFLTDGKIFACADVHRLPFTNKAFDYVYCVHVLEHVNDPAKACEEIMRVGKRGYIETPRRVSDFMFNLLKIPNFHKWYVSMSGNSLIFIEYSDYEQRNIGSEVLYKFAHAKYNNPIKQLVRRNMDLIKNMFLWKDSFNYFVFNKKGDLISTSKKFVNKK